MRNLFYSVSGVGLTALAGYAMHIVPKENAVGVLVIFVCYVITLALLFSFAESQSRHRAAMELMKYEDEQEDKSSG